MNKREIEILKGLVLQEIKSTESSIESIKRRHDFSDGQKYILTITHGKNYFKTKTILERSYQYRSRLNSIQNKLENLCQKSLS